MAFKFQPLSSANDLSNEGLRDEALAYLEVQAGTAILVPDDGSGLMQGFFIPKESKGMVAWGENAELSDWIKCNDLRDLFRKYIAD